MRGCAEQRRLVCTATHALPHAPGAHRFGLQTTKVRNNSQFNHLVKRAVNH